MSFIVRVDGLSGAEHWLTEDLKETWEERKAKRWPSMKQALEARDTFFKGLAPVLQRHMSADVIATPHHEEGVAA